MEEEEDIPISWSAIMCEEEEVIDSQEFAWRLTLLVLPTAHAHTFLDY